VPLQLRIEEGGSLPEAAEASRPRADLLDHARCNAGRIGAVAGGQIATRDEQGSSE
jgi:hypothetical protein